MKTVLTFILLAIASVGFSQETTETVSAITKKHEIKVGAIKLLAGPIFEGTYEYVHSKDFSYGSSVLINLQKDSNFGENFSITPFGRFYFQEKKEYGAQGFFVEGFGKYISGEVFQETYGFDGFGNYFYTVNPKKFTAGALGIALGKKWINNSGFVFEILFGGGRRLGSNDIAPDAFFRGDLNIGYRF
jgi:hypothetical protein